MKTGPTNFSCHRLILCFCLVLAAITAQCQKYGGIMAQGSVAEKGGGEMDSFDSSDPNHSIWQTGQVFRRNFFSPGINYGIWSNSLSFISNSYPSRTANFTLFADTNIVDIIGNIQVAGYLLTGQPGAIDTMSGQDSVGDLNWCFNGGGAGLQPGHWQSGVNLQFPSYSLPVPTNSANGWMNWSNVTVLPLTSATNIVRIGGMWTNSAGTWSYVGGARYTNVNGSGINIGGIVYHYVITNRLENTNWVYYEISDEPLTRSVFVDAQYVVLYLPYGLNYIGNGVFTLNTNADIQIWSGGDIIVSGPSAAVKNMGSYAPAFSLYDIAGEPIQVELNGNAMPPGLYYLPSSILQLSGGGASGDFVGSIFCNSLNDMGGANIHYDESLGVYLPPWIAQQPANQIVQTGSTATFTVNAGGSSPGYQWFFATTNDWSDTNSFYAAANMIPGATNSSLSISNAQLTNAGYYGAVITGSAGSIQSDVASLTVYTDATPVVSAMLNSTNGQFQLNITGVTGLNYTVEASSNLVDWVPLWTNAAPFNFTDSNFTTFTQRFYRSVFIQ